MFSSVELKYERAVEGSLLSCHPERQRKTDLDYTFSRTPLREAFTLQGTATSPHMNWTKLRNEEREGGEGGVATCLQSQLMR